MTQLSKLTLAEQIYSILRDDIISQRIKRGEKLTLKALQERFQVSSTPIREALTRLTQDHLVTYYSNVGVNVVQLTEKDIQEVYEFMGELDSLAIKFASSHPDQEQLLSELEKSLENAEASLKAQDTESWIHYSEEFHILFYHFCNNSRLETTAERMRSQLTIFANNYETLPENQKKIHGEHRKIFAVYRAGKYAEAVELMQVHLQHSRVYANRCLLD